MWKTSQLMVGRGVVPEAGFKFELRCSDMLQLLFSQSELLTLPNVAFDAVNRTPRQHVVMSCFVIHSLHVAVRPRHGVLSH